jgi:uncharacterized protein YdhG (YjbR/CyaY superfamily)
MATASPTSVTAYLAALPDDRRRALTAVRKVIRKNLPEGFEEGVQFGMISYHVPLSRYPDTYNGQPLMLAALASQKNYMAVYLMTVYATPERAAAFQSAYRNTGKRLDMGKSCVRFRTLEDLPLDLLATTISQVPLQDFLTHYEKARATTKPAKKKTTTKKTAPKRPTPKKPTPKKKPAR